MFEAIFNAVEAGDIKVYIPAMVFAENMYLGEKKRIEITLRDVQENLAQFSGYQQYPLDLAVVQAAAQISDLSELHDRLITNDLKMQASSFVRTVW